MSAHLTTEPELSTEAPAGARAERAPLPAVVTGMDAPDILERLATASRRGRLPGFEAGDRGGLFSVAAHGHPFDAVLVGHHQAGDGAGRLEFTLRLLPKMPAIFAAVLLVTVWPGVYFMDELLAQLAPGIWSYSTGHWGLWATWYWYVPMTVIPLPWVWASLMRRSRESTRAAAEEAIGKIAIETGGRVER
jgi:hypothetical protein